MKFRNSLSNCYTWGEWENTHIAHVEVGRKGWHLLTINPSLGTEPYNKEGPPSSQLPSSPKSKGVDSASITTTFKTPTCEMGPQSTWLWKPVWLASLRPTSLQQTKTVLDKFLRTYHCSGLSTEGVSEKMSISKSFPVRGLFAYFHNCSLKRLRLLI